MMTHEEGVAALKFSAYRSHDVEIARTDSRVESDVLRL